MRFLTGLVAAAICCGSSTVFAADSLSTEERLQKLERRIGKITDLTLQLDGLKRENRQLRGEIETQNHQIEKLKRKQRDLYLDIDQRLSGMTAAPVAASTQSARDDTAAISARSRKGVGAPVDNRGAVAASRSDKPADKPNAQQIQADYKAAYALLGREQKRYKDAAKAFTVFLEKYPQSSLSSNAQYWLAEAHYISQNNTEALAAFEKVVSEYPDSPKVAGALFKIGRLQHVAGNVGAAKKALNRVVKEFPDSSAAGLAKDRLAQIKREAR